MDKYCIIPRVRNKELPHVGHQLTSCSLISKVLMFLTTNAEINLIIADNIKNSTCVRAEKVIKLFPNMSSNWVVCCEEGKARQEVDCFNPALTASSAQCRWRDGWTMQCRETCNAAQRMTGEVTRLRPQRERERERETLIELYHCRG